MTSTIDLRKPPQTAQIWPFLKVGVLELMKYPEKISATEYANLSAAVHHVTVSPRIYALDLQQKLMEVLDEHLQSTAKEAANMVDVDLLRYYVTEFREYKTALERVNRLFAFFNRRWATKAEVGSVDDLLPSVDSLGLARWKEGCALVIQGDEKKITSAILQLIMKERNGENIEEYLVKDAINSFDQGGFYKEEFEAPFIKATADYYEKELEEVFQSENFIPDYLNKVEEKILEEERRAQRYLPPKTHNVVIKTLLINRHCEALAQKLLQTGDDEKLGGMYTLLSRVKPDGLWLLKETFGQYVRTELAKVMNTPVVYQTSVNMQDPELNPSLGIQQRHEEIVKTCFKGDYSFVEVLGPGGINSCSTGPHTGKKGKRRQK